MQGYLTKEGYQVIQYLPSFAPGEAPTRLLGPVISFELMARAICDFMPVDRIELLRSYGFELPGFDLTRRLVPVDRFEKFGSFAFASRAEINAACPPVRVQDLPGFNLG